MTSETMIALIIGAVIVSVSIVILTILIVVYCINSKRRKTELMHEIEIKKLDFDQKKEWEEIISKKVHEVNDENWIKEKNEINNKIDSLCKNRDEMIRLDMNRIAVLYTILAGNKNGLSVETMEKEMEQIRKSYELIQKYLNK